MALLFFATLRLWKHAYARHFSSPVRHDIAQSYVSGVPVAQGSLKEVPSKVMNWLRQNVRLCQPDQIHVMDGSAKEDQQLKVEKDVCNV